MNQRNNNTRRPRQNSRNRNNRQNREPAFKNYQFAMLEQDEKIKLLVSQLNKRNGKSVVVFCNSQRSATELSEWLKVIGFENHLIAGERSEDALGQIKSDFESNSGSIMVVEDYHSKSLRNVKAELVIHYEVARKVFDFKPRTWFVEGKGIKEGIFFCAFEDCASLDRITEFLKTDIKKIALSDSDFADEIPPKPEVEVVEVKRERNSRDRDQKREKSPRAERSPREERKPREAKGNKEDGPRKERTEKPKRQKREKTPEEQRKSNENNMRLKEFIIESTDPKIARERAMLHFKLDNDELLDEKVLEEGKKKFIFFGAQKNKYRYRLKPFYKKILVPFYIELFKKMDLKLFAKVSYKAPQLRVFFSGEDAGLMMRNRFELKNSIETISKLYLGQKLVLSKDLEFKFRVDKDRKDIDEKALKALVEEAIEKILDSKEAYTLKPLNPAERRICHQVISEDNRFQSESIGDGRLKKIKISLS